tara:strand:- start:9631 stop:11088 length:1458 start_codon:yes stop_codon:yes gene_type:complete
MGMKISLLTILLFVAVKSYANAPGVNTNLKVLSLSKNRMGDPGLVALMPAMMQAPNLETINLGETGITPLGVQTVAPQLPNVMGLKTLDLSSNSIGNSGGIALGQNMPNINVNLNIEGGNVGTPGVMSMFEGVAMNPRKSDFGVPNNPLGYDFAQQFSEFLKLDPDLKSVDLSGVEIKDAGLSMLAPSIGFNTVLEDINLSANLLTDRSILVFFSALRSNIHLAVINLSMNNITNRSMAGIASFLSANSSLKELNLSGNTGITDPGALALAGGLKYNLTLSKLDLTGCEIGPMGVNALHQIMAMNPNIEILMDGIPAAMPETPPLPNFSMTNPYSDFSQLSQGMPSRKIGTIDFPSFNMPPQDFRMLLGMLQRYEIGALDFSGSQVPESALSELAFQLPNLNVETLKLDNMKITDPAAASIARALVANTTVKIIFLRQNSLTDLSAKAFAELLKVNTQLEEIHMDGNRITAMGAKLLSDAFASGN